jgi:hypothetical protein
VDWRELRGCARLGGHQLRQARRATAGRTRLPCGGGWGRRLGGRVGASRMGRASWCGVAAAARRAGGGGWCR